MMKSIFSAVGLIAAASAYTQPGAQTFGALLTPDLSSPVTAGQQYSITWTPSTVAGQTVSLVLCNGPGSNCVLQPAAIVEGVPASQGSYSWSVPCSLPEGVQQTATGYGMLIIVDGTGEFQYSTQFSVQKGTSCSATTSSTTSPATSSSMTSSSATSSTLTTTSSSVTSSSSVSGSPSSSATSEGWYGWSSSANSTTPAYTASSIYTTMSAVVTSMPVAASSSGFVFPSSSYSSMPAATTSATPQPYTGAAAMPTAFANVAGLVGAGALALLAL